MQYQGITHILVDMDDTIIKTDYSNYLAYREAFKTVSGKELMQYNPKERFNRLTLMRYYPELLTEKVLNIQRIKASLYSKYLAYTSLNQEVLDYVKLLSHSKQIILVTKCSEQRVNEVLKYHKLSDLFANKLYYVKAVNKYACAIAELNISAKASIVFEDTQSEIEDAITAGVPQQQVVDIKKNITI